MHEQNSIGKKKKILARKWTLHRMRDFDKITNKSRTIPISQSKYSINIGNSAEWIIANQ